MGRKRIHTKDFVRLPGLFIKKSTKNYLIELMEIEGEEFLNRFCVSILEQAVAEAKEENLI